MPYVAYFIFRCILILSATTVFAENSVFDNIEDPDSVIEDSDSVFNRSSRTIHDSKANVGNAYYSAAKIIALNKITANSKEILLTIDQPVYFHNAEITLKKCWKSPDQYMPNDQVLVNVNEKKADEDSKKIFHGWLISSQPALSSVEHPVYEIFAVECRGKVIKNGR